MISRLRFEHEYQYKIFELLDTNSALKLKSFGNFGPVTVAELLFPQIIKSIENGKFLFYPFEISLSLYQDNLAKNDTAKIDVEEWEQNEDWTRSSLNFPFNFTEMGYTWIFQI